MTVIWQEGGTPDSLECCVFLSPFFSKLFPHGNPGSHPGRGGGGVFKTFSSKKGTATVLQLQEECLLCVVDADPGWNAE